MDWRDDAAYLTVDPELFFPVGNTGPAVDQIEKAKAVTDKPSFIAIRTIIGFPAPTKMNTGRRPDRRAAGPRGQPARRRDDLRRG